MNAKNQQRWLFKSEPTAYSIDDLDRDGSTFWDGVRNYQVRNMMRDLMKVGQQLLFYHSSCAAPGVVGTAAITSVARPDPTQFDPAELHFDAAAKPAAPRWLGVDICFASKAAKPYTLKQMRAEPKLAGLRILARGCRLSIVPLSAAHWRLIIARL